MVVSFSNDGNISPLEFATFFFGNVDTQMIKLQIRGHPFQAEHEDTVLKTYSLELLNGCFLVL